ncbi:MAG TPA: response regulator [Bacteroidota bacterium]|nr:response regulator [Bacteroidota bacterium]
MKILLAEDEPLSSFVLATRLRKLGYEVVQAADGREGWSLYRSEHPDVVITDWMMPNIDGLELTRMIRADRRPAYPYVIILTALSGKGSVMEGMTAGADDFMTKPCDIEILTARFAVAERMLNMHAELTQLRGLLPICPDCRKIRTGDATWVPLDSFIAAQSGLTFCPTRCPECGAKGS